jgi:hypothetical protein
MGGAFTIRGGTIAIIAELRDNFPPVSFEAGSSDRA